MSDLRERFRALDALEVPDVLSRARRIGPKPPEPDPTPPLRRVGALVFAAIVAVAAVVLITRALDERRPADPPTPTPTPSDTALRRDGEVITYTNDDARRSGDLVIVDPDTGEVRTLVAADALSRRLQPGEIRGSYSNLLIGSAAWSADGRWVAYEILACGGGFMDEETEGGLWVTNGVDEPRQLTRPCFEDPDVAPYNEFWKWSPAGAQLVVARRSIDGDSLVLIDAATGDRTDLGEAAGDVMALEWSPDGTRIAYGTVPTGTRDEESSSLGSVYSVGVGGGDHSLLASSLGPASGGETVSAIRWSPDGERIAVVAYVPGPRPATLYLMNTDGSDLHLVTEGVVIEHVLGSPGPVWSPDGTRMTYATLSGEREELQIWNGSPDGSTPVLVFESTPAPGAGVFAVGPVWSPDGTRIAFPFSTTYLVANADGTGDASEIDELRYLSWRGGWYFCECYG